MAWCDWGATPSRLGLEVVRIVRDDLGPLVGHEDDVLEPHAPVAGAIQARLDPDHVAPDKGLDRVAAHARRLVHPETDPVAERVKEAVDELLAGLLGALRRLARRFED